MKTTYHGKTIAMTGASGAFGAPLKLLLEKQGARVIGLKFGTDWTYDDYSKIDSALMVTDVLILAHGSKVERAMEANCDSFVAFIERFRELKSRTTPEIWAVGSEIEFHPSWGNRELEIYSKSKRAFAAYASRLFRDTKLIYRHIVPSAFTSPMGPGLISGTTAAKIALFGAQRGWRYIPVTYTGLALLNYFRFVRLAAASRSRHDESGQEAL